ncbi:recombinase RecA [Halobacteriales archaeon QS_1_68_20]|nr:MAG: recombinase RecA [Halobacteriales archaeon QS_1_68_20]
MYEFDDLPLSPIEPATNVLVAGPAMSGTRDLFLRMLAPPAGSEDGTIVVTSGDNADELYERFRATARDVDRQQLGVVDCVSRSRGLSVDGPNVGTVSSPGDLTGIGIELTDLYESFFERGVRRLRTGLNSISTLLMYADQQPLFRFLHVFTGRISTAESLGLFVIDPTSHDERTTQTINQLYDARIEVRQNGSAPELRVRGLPDQPTDWTPF